MQRSDCCAAPNLAPKMEGVAVGGLDLFESRYVVGAL